MQFFKQNMSFLYILNANKKLSKFALLYKPNKEGKNFNAASFNCFHVTKNIPFTSSKLVTNYDR